MSPNSSKLIRSNGQSSVGCCNKRLKTIYINGHLKIEKIYKVLCHEITHAAMFSYNITLSPKQEELIADLIATYGKEIVQNTDTIFNTITRKRGTI